MKSPTLSPTYIAYSPTPYTSQNPTLLLLSTLSPTYNVGSPTPDPSSNPSTSLSVFPTISPTYNQGSPTPQPSSIPSNIPPVVSIESQVILLVVQHQNHLRILLHYQRHFQQNLQAII